MHAKVIVFLTCVMGLGYSIPVPNVGAIVFSLHTELIRNMQQPVKDDCSANMVYTIRLFRLPKPIASTPVPLISGSGLKCGRNKKCVRRNLCSNGVINDDGASLIDLRMDDDSTCTADETCCSIADIVEKPISTTSVNNPGKQPTAPSTNTGNHAQCGKGKKCVRKNLCSNGFINEDGATLIDLRMDDDSSCHATETCCSIADIIDEPVKSPELKPTEKLPTLPVTSSGIRLPCGYPKKCVLRDFCSNETADDGATHINIRTSMYDDVHCQSNETCCFLEDIVNIHV